MPPTQASNLYNKENTISILIERNLSFSKPVPLARIQRQPYQVSRECKIYAGCETILCFYDRQDGALRQHSGLATKC